MEGARIAYQLGGVDRPPLMSTIPAFTAYNFLRNCNYFLGSHSQEDELDEKITKNSNFTPSFPTAGNERSCSNLIPKHHVFTEELLLPYSHSLQIFRRDPLRHGLPSDCPMISPTSTDYSFKKQRSEKKPIPDEQKDDKYFERRRRNNQAAKKSRDARKIREDQIALKATILEHENAILRAQVITLREEATSLRQMLLHRKSFEIPPSPEAQICVLT